MALEDIFSAGARKTDTYDLNGITLNLKEMSWQQQKEYAEIPEDADTAFRYSCLICLCCEELDGVEPEKLMDEWSAQTILAVGNKIITLSSVSDTEKK